MPAVSVIIPAYNASRTIAATVQSVLDQTFSDFEVIVVDDGSSDDTAHLALSRGGPVRCIRTANGGVSRARNRGIAESTGQYLAFLDADDLWLPRKLECQVDFMERSPVAGGCYVSLVIVDQNMRERRQLPAKRFSDLCASLLLEGSVIPSSPSSLLLRRAVDAEVGGFDPRFSQCADWDYLLRLSRMTTLVPIDEVLLVYRTGCGNMSGDVGLLERDLFAVLNRFFTEERSARYQALRRQTYSNQWTMLAGAYLHSGDWSAAVRCLLRGLRLDPGNIMRPLKFPIRWFRGSSRLNTGAISGRRHHTYR